MNNIMAGNNKEHGQLSPELNIDNIMKAHQALSVENVNHTIEIMNRQFKAVTPAMFYTSDLYYSAKDGKDWKTKVNKTLRFIQIHYIKEPYDHFLLSMHENGQVSIFDSVNNTLHKTSLLPQLRMIYEDFNENDVRYIVPEIQGNEDSNLCGFFAIANAVSLLNMDEPGYRPFKQNCMRNHLYHCITRGTLFSFPCSESPEKRKLRTKNDIPDMQDLGDLCKCLGENWYNLALFVANADIDVFMGNVQVRGKLITHFACTKEMIKGKNYPKFDVFLHDVLRKIYLLMCTQIDWEKLKNAIMSKSDIITQEEMESVFEVVQNFEIFWIIFEMPHLKVLERMTKLLTRLDDASDEIDKEVYKLNNEIEMISSSNNYDTNVRKEKEKFLKFLNHDVLVKCASTSSEALLERIQLLSKVDVNFELLREKFESLGVPDGMENQMHSKKLQVAAPMIDIHKVYVIETDNLVGVCVKSKRGTATTGWCFEDDQGIKTTSTCAHSVFGSDQMKKLSNDNSGYQDHKLDCYISSNSILFEVYKAIYKQGSIDQGGVEIALMRMKGSKTEEKWCSESVVEPKVLQQWKELELPRKLEFKGRYIPSRSKLYEGVEVYKIGNKTGITKGKIQETGIYVPSNMTNENYIIELDSQAAVEWTDNKPFSERGDSGGVVFQLEKGQNIAEMVAVGMVQSSEVEERRSFITLTSDILNACNGCTFVPFTLLLKEKEPDGRTCAVA